MAWQMTPSEVMQRFTERELVHLVAYENLYGQLGPERYDTLFGRLGMDVVAPHMKKGKKPKIEDHMVKWGGKSKRKRQTPEEMLRVAQGIQGAYDRDRRRKGKAPQRYRVREKGGLPQVVDTRTGKTEWSGLDQSTARQVADGLNKV